MDGCLRKMKALPAKCRMEDMDAPFASGPVELFERLDNESVASAAAAAQTGTPKSSARCNICAGSAALMKGRNGVMRWRL